MYKKTTLALIILVVLTSGYTVLGANYTDITDHWSKAQVNRWSDYDVIHGSNGLFRPNDFITRGEMAVIMDKVMLYQIRAENTFSDLDNSFYTDSILKANYAGAINGSDGFVRPKDYITREEAAVLMCKVFNIPESSQSNSNFADSSNISTWAKSYVNALSNKKYINGRGGAINNFDPRGNITRAEAVTIVDNIVKGFYNRVGTYSTNTNGNVVVNTSNVILKDMNITGNLIVAEGVSEGDFTLDGVKVSGSVILKGGGVNSIYFKGNTSIPNVEIEKTDGDMRIDVSESANIDMLNIPENAKNIILEGKIENVQSKASYKISLINANISNLSILGKNANIDLDKNSKVRNVLFSEMASASKLNLQGEITQLNINSPQSVITSTQSSKIETLNTSASASNIKMDISGEVKSVNIGSSDTLLKSQKYSNIENIDTLKTAYNLNAEIMGKSNKITILSEKSSFTSSNDAEIDTIAVEENAKLSKLYINGDTSTLNLKAPDINVTVHGNIKKIDTYKTAKNAKIYAEKDCKIETVNTDAEKTEISGEGNVKYVYVNADNSKIDTVDTKIVVASGVYGTTAKNHNIYAGTSGSINSNGDISTDDGYYDDMYGQSAPTGLTTIAPTSWRNEDGKIVGTTKKMQYKKIDDSTYKDCGEGETTGLSPGKYYVRYKANINYYVGKTTTVTIENYDDNSTDTNIAIVDKKINVVRNIDNSNKTINVVVGATVSELLNGIKSLDNSIQTYTLYTSDGETKITYMYETDLNNTKLRVTAKNGDVSRIYTVRQVDKSSNLDLSLINTNKVISVDNINYKIKVTSDATKSQIESAIRASDRSEQIYNFYKSATSNDIYIGTESINGVRLRVTSEDGKQYRDYIINEPVQKTVSLGSQIGNLTAEIAGEVRFNVTTKNIADTQEIKIVETDINGNIKPNTSGLTITSTKVYNNLATVTAKISNSLKAGNYYFKITVDGITSSVATVKVDAPIVVKTVSIGNQVGSLESGKAGNVKFDINTKNIADAQKVTVFETDSSGNKKSATSGLKFSAENTKSNKSTVTATIDTTVNAGTYYFKVTVDGITSSVATVKVDAPIIIKTVSVGTQAGSLESGTAGSAVFDVNTKNIADTQKVTVFETDSSGNKKSATSGLRFDSEDIKSNKSTITATIDTTVNAGTYYFKVSVDGVISSVAMVKVDAPIIIKTVSVGTQTGSLQSGTAGSATFNVNTKNIADAQKVTVFETDSSGNKKSATSGLRFDSENIKSNKSTVTATIDTTVNAGTYYFKVSVDGVTSSVATIKVDVPIIIKTISVGTQAGYLESGISGSTTFNVQFKNIADGEDIFVTETDASGNSKNTQGLRIVATKILNNMATVIVTTDNIVKAGNYYFKVTCDGVVSNIATINVDEYIVIKTISIGTQSGILESGTAGNTKFDVNTQNIADAQRVVVFETDSAGNQKSTTFGLEFFPENTKSNKSTVTVRIDTAVKAGTYYFKVTIDGITSSNVAEIKVNKATRKQISVLSQNGKLTSGETGSAIFNIQAQNIADGEDVFVTETDASGNSKNTQGLRIVATKTLNNTAIVTVTTDSTVKAGNYYFKATCDGVVSNIATIKVGEPIVTKSISLSPQMGNLTSGIGSEAKIMVTTKNITNGQEIRIIETDIDGNAKTETAGLTITSTKVYENFATITVKTSNSLKGGTYYFKVYVEGIMSSVSTIEVDEAIVVKTVSVDVQSGNLESGISGSTTFNVQFENIADGEDVFVTETDDKGNKKTTQGLTITSTKITGNQATVTVAIDNTIKAGNYYFKVTSDGIVSNIATIKVDEITVPNIDIIN